MSEKVKKPVVEETEEEVVEETETKKPVAKAKVKVVKEAKKPNIFKRTGSWLKNNWKPLVGGFGAGAATSIGTAFVVGKVTSKRRQQQALGIDPMNDE